MNICKCIHECIHDTYIYTHNTYIHDISYIIFMPPKNGLIALWPSTNGAIPCFLVLPGIELSITEITWYRCFSPLKPIRELTYTSE